MQPSPYTPGAVTTYVPGREVPLAAVRERLSYVKHLQRLAGQIRVDIGPRGIGKTSLLRTIQAEAADEGFVTVWVTAGDTSLLQALLEEFDRIARTWKDSARDGLRAILDRLSFSIAGVGLARSAAPKASGRPPSSTGRALGEVLARATHEVLADGGAGLAVFIDEIQSADADGLRALAYAWQHLQAEEPTLPAAVFTAGLGHTQDVITDAASFAERFRYNHLTNLDAEAAMVALAGPARAAGVEWREAALTGALAEANGYPYFLQLIGDAAWQAAGYPDPGAQISVEHLAVGLEAFTAARTDLFRARWNKASPREAEMLTAIASLGDGPQRRKDIAAALAVSSTALSMARRSLMDKGLIEATGRGLLDFTAPGFAQFIRDEQDLEST